MGTKVRPRSITLKGRLPSTGLMPSFACRGAGIVRDSGAWPDDPLETDEVHLHLAVTRRFHEATEITPNEMHFHTLAEMREHLGIGRLLKEEKIADHRPKAMPAIVANA
jgi:hypothetical protein